MSAEDTVNRVISKYETLLAGRDATIEGLGQQNTDLERGKDELERHLARIQESFAMLNDAFVSLQNQVLQASEGIRLLRSVPLQHLDDAVTEVADQVKAIAVGP